MLLHYQTRICLSGHSKFDMDWNLFLQNYPLPPPNNITHHQNKISDPPSKDFSEGVEMGHWCEKG